MDKSMQPGISFDGIILVEENFSREFEVPQDSNIDLDIQNNNILRGKSAEVELIATIRLIAEDKTVLELRSKFIGFFSVIEEGENMDLSEYISNNASALMLPYIREHITAITAKAGISPILLPPLNIIALQNKK